MSRSLAALAARSASVAIADPWGGETAWRIWNDRAPEPVVLLHGGTGSWMHWARTIPALEGRYRLLAPDLPGMGRSGAPPPIEPIEALVEAMARALDRGLEALLGDRPFHVVGFSFGAMTGAFVAAWRPRQVRTYTMIGASGLGLAHRGPDGLRKLTPDLDPAGARAVHRANLAAIMFADPDNLDETALEMQLDNARHVRVRTHAAAGSRVMLAPLRAVGATKHAVWGRHDPYLATDRGALAALLGELGFAWRVLEGAGHWAQYEGAEAMNRHLACVLAGPGAPDAR